MTTLINAGISPAAATRALDSACKYDGRTFGSALDRESARAVLRLMAVAGLGSHSVQETLSGIASTHPGLALDHLVEVAHQARGWRQLPDDIYGLRSGFETQADALVRWFVKRLGPDSRTESSVLAAALNDELTHPIAEAMAEVVPRLRGQQVLQFIDLLGAITFWAITHPRLAEALLLRARQTRIAGAALERIRDTGMRTRGYSWANGVSEELNRAARQAADALASTTDDGLREGYEDALVVIRRAIDDVAHEHALDEQQDW